MQAAGRRGFAFHTDTYVIKTPPLLPTPRESQQQQQQRHRDADSREFYSAHVPWLRPLRCGAVGGLVLPSIPGLVGRGDLQIRGLHVPDVPGVLLDGAVAGELAGRRDVPDHHLSPGLGVLQGEGVGLAPRLALSPAAVQDPALSTSCPPGWDFVSQQSSCPVPRLALTRYSSLTFSWHLT